MFYLILTVCTTVAMDDCQLYSVNKTATENQCMVVADVYRRTLSDGPDKNYRIECEYQEVGDER